MGYACPLPWLRLRLTTRRAHGSLGLVPHLCVTLARVILEGDADRVRAIAREALGIYSQPPNYRKTWRRPGLSDDDIDTSSDKLVDALSAWGRSKRSPSASSNTARPVPTMSASS
jgi:hypothetical protein